jgi:L-rhamnose mutarotase
MDADQMQRVCFCLQVRPDRLEEYAERHAAVWPDMLEALERTGWRNYSLFLRDDGLLIGYFETPSLDAALAGMADTEVNSRWQREMAELFVDFGDARPDTGFLRLREVFHLEDQLAARHHQHLGEELT